MNLTSSVTVTDLHTPLLYSNLHFINSYDAKSNATCWLHCFHVTATAKNNDYRFKFERRTTANQLVKTGNR